MKEKVTLFSRVVKCVCVFLVLTMLMGCQPTVQQNPSAGASNPTSDPATLPVTNPTTIPTEPTTTPTEAKPVKQVYKILFIGNSYTYYNSMPKNIFSALVTSAGHYAVVTAITNGGYKLSQFADPKDEYGAKVEEALNGNMKYDFVVLQEQSVLPAKEDASEFYDAVRNLVQRIRATGAQPILYATWGRKTGSGTLAQNGWTNETMTYRLAASYQAIGAELQVPVVHVGMAFYDIYTHAPEINLYNEDASHPSYEGSYLAAACLVAQIYQIDPSTISFSSYLDEACASALREAARKAVYETPAIPDEYRIDLSVG